MKGERDAAIHTLNALQGSSIHTRVDPRSTGFQDGRVIWYLGKEQRMKDRGEGGGWRSAKERERERRVAIP